MYDGKRLYPVDEMVDHFQQPWVKLGYQEYAEHDPRMTLRIPSQ
jgi:hypothetical protein